MAQPSEPGHRDILDMFRRQTAGQYVGIELRIVARTENGAAVGQPFDAIRLQLSTNIRISAWPEDAQYR